MFRKLTLFLGLLIIAFSQIKAMKFEIIRYEKVSEDGRPLTFEEILQEAEEGDAVSQYEIGNMYLDGDVIEEDYKEGIRWLTLSANQGLADAQYLLGYYYSIGWPIGKDQEKTAQLFYQCAQQGNELAQKELGDCYLFGYGVP